MISPISLVLFPLLPHLLLVSATNSHLTSLIGSDIVLKCKSSFKPPWNKFGPSNGDFHIVGLNGERHPNWKETRYSFFNENTDHFLRITGVHLADAGRFVCGSDSPVSFIVTVIR